MTCAPEVVVADGLHLGVGGALTLENLLLFDGGLRFTNASGMVHIKDIPADTDATSATRCRSTFSRRQKSGIKSLVRNIS